MNFKSFSFHLTSVPALYLILSPYLWSFTKTLCFTFILLFIPPAFALFWPLFLCLQLPILGFTAIISILFTS